MNITEFLEARIAEDEANRFAMTSSRAMAECAAKRAILNAHQRQENDDDPSAWIVASEVLLRSLAAIYKDHEEYKREWANESQ